MHSFNIFHTDKISVTCSGDMVSEGQNHDSKSQTRTGKKPVHTHIYQHTNHRNKEVYLLATLCISYLCLIVLKTGFLALYIKFSP